MHRTSLIQKSENLDYSLYTREALRPLHYCIAKLPAHASLESCAGSCYYTKYYRHAVVTIRWGAMKRCLQQSKRPERLAAVGEDTRRAPQQDP